MPDNTVAYSRIPAEVAERWAVVRDVCAGDQRLRAEPYLTKLNPSDMTLQNAERNSAYRERAVLYTATSFTRDGLLGLAFRNDPQTDKMPKGVEFLIKDADGAGVSIFQQSQAVLANNLEVGRHGLYVDFSASLKRPVIKSYLAEDIINWRYDTTGGKAVLDMIVLRETYEEHDGYEVVSGKQYREIRLEGGVALVRLWRDAENEHDDPVLQTTLDADGAEVDELALRSRAGPLDYIPFQFVGSQNNDADIDDSPLYGLAKVNLAHFRNSADYEDMVWRSCQAQFWMAGLDVEWRDHLEAQGSLYVGSLAPMLLPAGGACGFAQVQPNTLAKEAMDQKEKQMIALGARLIDQTRALKTATESDANKEATTSVLALCVANTSEAYQTVIGWCGRFLDLKFDVADVYKINQDFVRAVSDPQLIDALVSAWQSGVIAKADVRAFFRRQGTLAVERSDTRIDADIEQEGPPLGSMGVDPLTGLPPVTKPKPNGAAATH